MSKAKLMLGNAVEISLIFRLILGPFSFGLGPQSFCFRDPACSMRKKVSLPASTAEGHIHGDWPQLKVLSG